MKKYLLPLILLLILALGFTTGYAQEPGENKYWINTWTEIEELGGGKFGATIYTGHQVFKDKTDGQYKKRKLTDNRLEEDYIVIQSAKVCIEIYPYYAKYYDVDHEEVRLEEERWVVQRLFKAPDTWRDVDAYNPVISIEEVENVIKVTIIYDTDYGELTVEYLQRDGSALKHNVYFKNTSGGEETFRVLQRWAGIAGDKCNGKDFPANIDEPFLAFHDSDKPQKKFNIAENLYSMVFNPDGSEKTDQCLQRPINIETHAQGMKADFIYGNWVLAQDERLEIDPDTATLNNPAEDGAIKFDGIITYTRYDTEIDWVGGFYWEFMGTDEYWRGYVEWDISSLAGSTLSANPIFKYHGRSYQHGCHIHEMLATRPTASADAAVWAEAGGGTAYDSAVGFPVVGTNQQQDLGSTARTDLQGLLDVSTSWFAIGIQNDDEANKVTAYTDRFYSEEYATATPKPTLYVEYIPPAAVNVIFFSTPF